MQEQLKVGFGRVDITPEKFGPMGGFGNDHLRICTEIVDRVLGTCVAIGDESGKTYLMFCVDLIKCHEDLLENTRREVAKLVGVPGDQLFITATHTHTGPSVSFPELEPVSRYMRYCAKQLAKAAREAMEDMANATVQIGRQDAPNLTFVRHYLMNDGTYAGSGFGSWESGIKDHAATADTQLQLIRFVREEAADILLVNWQAHVTPFSYSNRGNMSADYVGVLRNQVEGVTGCRMAFFQGACGNLVPTSKIEEENVIEDPKDYIAYGRKLAEQVLKGLEKLHPAKTGALQSRRIIYKAVVDHSTDHMEPVARKIWDAFNAGDAKLSREMAMEVGFNSPYEASGILDRLEMADMAEMELNVVTAGDISFATIPCELFCSNGMYLKEKTPFAMTFVVGYCNGAQSYFPDKKAFAYRSYEVDTRLYVEGTTEDIVQTHLDTLKELKKAEK